MEDIHSAAFRDTLGRSIYAPEYMVGKYNTEMLLEYVQQHYTAENMALVGVGKFPICDLCILPTTCYMKFYFIFHHHMSES